MSRAFTPQWKRKLATGLKHIAILPRTKPDFPRFGRHRLPSEVWHMPVNALRLQEP